MNNIKSYILKHPTIAIVIGFQLFRLFLLPFMGLMPQDAYYHFYGEHLALSYFDHPGMIGYLLRGFTEVFGKTVFVVKLADFVVTSLTLFIFYKLAKLFLSRNKAENALVLMCSTLFISILSFNSTPDVPLLLFWTLSIYSLYKAVFEKKKLHWILAGIAMGLAFNSKYTALLLQIGLLFFILFSNRYRKLLVSPWLWMSLLLSTLITFPVWYWNYQNDFASFAFQASKRTGDISKFQLKPNYFFGAIGHQLVILLPVLFAVFIKFTYEYVKRALLKFKLPPAKTLFLLAFFIPTFVGFFALTPIYWVKLNWMMPSYITGVLLASLFISKKWIKIQLISSVGLHLLLALQILFYIVPIKSDDTWVGWKELADSTKVLQEKYPDTFIFSNDHYKTSAILNFYLDKKVYAGNIIGLKALQFDYIGDDLSLLNHKNALFIDSDKSFNNKDLLGKIPKELAGYFESIIELTPIIIKLQNKEVRKFWVYYCSNYQPEK